MTDISTRLLELCLSFNHQDLFFNVNAPPTDEFCLRVSRARRIWDRLRPGWHIYFLVKTWLATAVILLSEHFSENEPLQQAKWFLGDPMAATPGYRLIILINAPLASFIYSVLAPDYVRIQLNAMPTLKFILKPQRELERLDETIKEAISITLNSLDQFKLNLLRVKQCQREPDCDKLHWKLINRYQKILIDCNKEIERFRPITYNEVFLQELRSRLKIYLSIFVTYIVFWLIMINIGIPLSNLLRLCLKTYTKSLCSPFKVFTWSSLLLYLETALNTFSMGVAITYDAISLGFVIRHQVITIKGNRQDLEQCLMELRLAHQSNHLKQADGDSSMERAILGMLIKTQLYDSNMKSCTNFLTKSFLVFLVNGFHLSLVSLITRHIYGSNYLIDTVLFSWWVNTNIILLFGSFVSARISRQTQLFRSIEAELALYERGKASVGADYLARLWRKHVVHLLSEHRSYAASVLGVRLVYLNAIRFNYYLMSVVLWVTFHGWRL